MSILKSILKKMVKFKIVPFEPRIPMPGDTRRIDIDNTDRTIRGKRLADTSGDNTVKYKRTQNK